MDIDIDLISTCSILAPAIVGAIFYTRFRGVIKVLYWLIFVTLIIEAVTRVLYEFQLNNMYFFHFYSFFEFTWISLIYYEISKSKTWKTYILSVFLVFQLFSLVNLFFLDDFTHFNAIQRNIEAVILMSFFIAFIRRCSFYGNEMRSHMKPLFWLTYGYMIYFAGTVFLFLFANEILKDQSNDLWAVHGVFNIFLNGIYSVVFLIGWKSKWLSRSS